MAKEVESKEKNKKSLDNKTKEEKQSKEKSPQNSTKKSTTVVEKKTKEKPKEEKKSTSKIEEIDNNTKSNYNDNANANAETEVNDKTKTKSKEVKKDESELEEKSSYNETDSVDNNYQNKDKFPLLGVISMVLAIVFTIIMFNTQNRTGDPVDFSRVNEEGVYSSIDVSLMTYSLGDPYASNTLHIVADYNNYYVVKVKFDDWDKLSGIREYTYGNSSAPRPKAITISGKSVPIDEETKRLVIEGFDQINSGENINAENFEDYFGLYYLDTSKEPYNDMAALFFIGVCLFVTIGAISLTKYFKKKSKLTLTSTIFLIVSWVLFFGLNTPSDFENTMMIFLGFYLIILATIIWVYALLKLKTPNNSSASSKAKDLLIYSDPNNQPVSKNVKRENEYTNKPKEKILQLVYKKYESFMEKNSFYLIFFGGRNDMYREELDEKKKSEMFDYTKLQFLASMFIKILLNSNPNTDEREKTLTFLNNIDSDIVEHLDIMYDLKDEEIKKALEEENSHRYMCELFPGLTFRDWLRKSFHELAYMKDSGWDLTEEKWKEFLITIQDAYNAYVEPVRLLDILGDYQKTSDENKKDASTKALYMFYLPIILIILMAISFFIELFDEPGIVMSGGWTSVGIFVVLIIWACAGSSGKNNTCSTCHKWNALRLDCDTIIDARDTWRTKTFTDRNGKSYQKQVAVRLERHQEDYTCTHCGAKETKYRNTEREL